jgi:hypothetical protein
MYIKITVAFLQSNQNLRLKQQLKGTVRKKASKISKNLFANARKCATNSKILIFNHNFIQASKMGIYKYINRRSTGIAHI